MFNLQPVGWMFSIRQDSLLRAAIVLACVHSSLAFAQDGKEARKNEAKGPANHVVYQTNKAGAFFVEKALMDRYEELMGRLDALRGEIDDAKIEPKDAKAEVERLAKDLRELRDRLDAAKVYVGAVGVHSKTVAERFAVQEKDFLLIVADHVDLRGWDKPEVYCVLEKTVLGDDSKQVSDDLEIIKIDRRRIKTGKAAELPEFRRFGYRLGEDAWIKPFLDRDFTYLSVRGIAREEGNGSIGMHVSSEHGGEWSGGSSRRWAKLTVFVPKAVVRVGVQGGLMGFKARDLSGTLAVRGRSENGFAETVNEVLNLNGSLEAENMPIQRIESVSGDVSFLQTNSKNGSGNYNYNQHGVTVRLGSRPLTMTDIGGNVRTRLLRAEVDLERIKGRVDVENEFGRTVWVVATPPAKLDHRIVSQAGTIELKLGPKVLGDLELNLFTECGSLFLDPESSGLFETLDFTTVDGDRSGSFHGFVRRGDRDRVFFPAVDGMNRVTAALHDRNRDPGIDLISRGGSVRIVAKP